MPFWSLHDESEPEIRLRQVSPNAFQLLEGFRFVRPGEAPHRAITVPAHDPGRPPSRGNVTDLASVPWFLWWFISSHGRHTRAALLHDHLVTDPHFDRREADVVFREALADAGVSWVRRWVMWGGVTIGTKWKRDRFRLLLFVAHLVASYVLMGLWLFGGGISAGWAAAGLVTGVVWGVLWPLGVVGMAVLGPPTVFVGMAVAVIYAIELAENVVASARGKRFEMPKAVPYRDGSGRF